MRYKIYNYMYPTKILCILVPAPYLHQFFALVLIIHFFGAIWDTFALVWCSFSIKSSPSNGAIWDEFCEHH